MANNHIFELAAASQREHVGGKAYALGEMIRANFNVPNGFVLSADIFTRMTPAIKDSLLEQFDALDAPLVAVRSSAINEDGANDTWAGQLETFLNCRRDNVLPKIEACWKSAKSSRAQSYAKQRNITSAKIAVIVQEMIQSEVSGVSFSVHPISNDKTQMIIEAGFGLGEAIVSGQITPDSYIVNKATKQIIDTRISQQKTKLVQHRNGVNTWFDTGGHSDQQKLSDKLIEQVCELTVQLERFFGFPVDVEWAMKGGKIYILQARPITALTQK